MALKGLRSDFKTVREMGDLRQAVGFALVKALGLARTVEVTIDGIQLNVRPNSPDLHVARKTIGGEFEDVIRAAQPIKHRFIVDAGGYIGTASIVFARAFPTATIVTIEPSHENFEILKKNTAKYPNIRILNAALGPQEGRASFYDRGSGPWGYSLLKTSESGPSTKTLHEVETVTIPGILRGFSATGIDLLKLDIEGAEKGLLANAPSWVSDTRVIVAELHDWIVDGCEETFRAATTGRCAPERSGELTISVAISH